MKFLDYVDESTKEEIIKEWFFDKKEEPKVERKISLKDYPNKIISELKKLFAKPENKDVKSYVKINLDPSSYKNSWIDESTSSYDRYCIIGSYKIPDPDIDDALDKLHKIQNICNKAVSNLKDATYDFDWNDSEANRGDLVLSDKDR